MKTLVYIASGNYRKEFESLPYDRVYLVDIVINTRFKSDKVIPLKMDALDSVDYFRMHSIKIDCLVCICESRGEGGATYAMCSDVIMGYFMTILPKNFIWIANDSSYYDFSTYNKGRPPINCNVSKGSILNNDGKPKNYNTSSLHNRCGKNYVSLDLPYYMKELNEGDHGYLSPYLFSSLFDGSNHGHVFQMSYSPSIECIAVNEKITIRFVCDSIWNHQDELDHSFISFKLEDSRIADYFERKVNVSYYKQMEFYDKLIESAHNGYNHIGFTPHYWHQYDRNYKNQLVRFALENKSELTIDFYYLSSWFSVECLRKAVKQIKLTSRSH